MKPLLFAVALSIAGCSQPDKLMHLVAGGAAGVVGDNALDGRGCELAIAVGLAKELIDPVFSTLDLIATSAYCLTLLKEGNQ